MCINTRNNTDLGANVSSPSIRYPRYLSTTVNTIDVPIEINKPPQHRIHGKAVVEIRDESDLFINGQRVVGQWTGNPIYMFLVARVKMDENIGQITGGTDVTRAFSKTDYFTCRYRPDGGNGGERSFAHGRSVQWAGGQTIPARTA